MTSYRKIPLVDGEYFHVYNRGNSKQEIFIDNEDRERFVKLLYLSNSEKRINFRDDIVERKIDALDFDRGNTLVSIGAWVLMPNHFHLYVTSPTRGVGERNGDKSSISLFLNKLCTSYSKYFNKKYNRTGSLFEGRFQAVHLKDDVQAKYLFSYIHLNPIKLIDSKWKEEGIKDKNQARKFLDEYKWSSYFDYKGVKRNENKILNRDGFINYFPEISDFDKEIFEWIDSK